jgi:hypothetical protein
MNEFILYFVIVGQLGGVGVSSETLYSESVCRQHGDQLLARHHREMDVAQRRSLGNTRGATYDQMGGNKDLRSGYQTHAYFSCESVTQ